MRGRAYVRHQRDRNRRKAAEIVARWRIQDMETRQRLIRIIEKNRRKCSCWMCQRSRDVRGPSMQEMRQPQMYVWVEAAEASCSLNITKLSEGWRTL